MSFAEYIGLPFKSLGRDRSGVDCAGLVLLVLRERFGIEAPDYLFDYPDALDAEAVSSVVQREAATRWRRVHPPREGDVVVFRIGRLQSHVGLVIDGRRFLHIQPGASQSCTQSLDAVAWRHRIAGFYRYEQ
jgi:probable lipoprotein NlpC